MKNILCKSFYGWIFLFHLGKNISVVLLPVFQSSSTILYFHQQHIKIPVAPQSCQLLVLTAFSTLAILKLVKWYLVVLFGVSLMINDGKHFSDVYWQFLYLCEMFKIFVHFKQGGFSHLFLEAYSEYETFVR